MAGRTFGADSSRRTSAAARWLIAAGLSVQAGIYVGIGDAFFAAVPATLAIGFAGAAIYTGWYLPYRVTIDDPGVTLEGCRRQIFIPWSELRSVELRFGRTSALIWRSRSGRNVRTLARFDGLSTMLEEVRRRSPRTAIVP